MAYIKGGTHEHNHRTPAFADSLYIIGDCRTYGNGIKAVVILEATIISSLISAGVALLICIIQQNKSRAVMEYRIEELTREVRSHNEFASRIPVLEEKINSIDHRLSLLEKEAS